jgi:hypothetical protein
MHQLGHVTEVPSLGAPMVPSANTGAGITTIGELRDHLQWAIEVVHAVAEAP